MVKSFFSGTRHAKTYSKYRPKYPIVVAETVTNFARKTTGNWRLNRIVDVGCGTGQSTSIYSSFAKEVIGLDPSINQIKEAEKLKLPENVNFVMDVAEQMPFADQSVDIVTCAASVHWFNWKTFLRECDRVLTPNGCLALYCYLLPTPIIKNSKLNGKTLQKQTKILNDDFYVKLPWHKEVSKVWNRYDDFFHDLPSPTKVKIDTTFTTTDKSFADIYGFIRSLAGYRNHIKIETEKLEASLSRKITTEEKLEIDVALKYIKELKKLWQVEHLANEQVKTDVEWELFYVLSRRPCFNC